MPRKISKFKMPTKSDLKSRTSTISNAFTIAITPYITPSQEEIDKLLQELEVEEGQCVYCLRKANATDHFRPLVKDGMPNGYISDIEYITSIANTVQIIIFSDLDLFTFSFLG